MTTYAVELLELYVTAHVVAESEERAREIALSFVDGKDGERPGESIRFPVVLPGGNNPLLNSAVWEVEPEQPADDEQ